MATKFTKGGILNTTQLQNLSGKKWKKGGILSATQLNELTNNDGDSLKRMIDGSITKIDIPDSITAIRKYAFYDCTKVTEVKLSKNITLIGRAVFYNLASEIEANIDIVIPEGCVTISDEVFQDANVKSITIPSTVTYVGRICKSCKAEKIVFNCENVTLQVGTFESCTNLTDIILPSKLTTIGGNMFKDCTALKKIHIPSTVTDIAHASYNNAFAGCSDITIDCGFAEGAVAGAPWGATNATINYNVPAPSAEE